jgi:hypothetical protein
MHSRRTEEALVRSLVLLVVALLTLVAVGAAAQTDTPAVPFGLVGLARGETARLNVVNLVPPDPCHVTLQFLDAAGQAFPGAGAEADLAPGQATHLDLPSGAAFATSAATVVRRRVRASVESSAGSPSTNGVPPGPCIGLVSTLELFDSFTGRLVAFYKPPGLPIAPAPTTTSGPPDAFGMVGLARLQAAALTVINLAPAAPGAVAPSCRVSLTFLDEAGQMFPSGGTSLQNQADLMPGQFATLALPASVALASSRDVRQAFRARVEVNPGPISPPPDPCEGLVNTLEVVDTLTGRTQLIYPAGADPVPPGTSSGPADVNMPN